MLYALLHYALQIAQQQQFLEDSVRLWEEFESVTTPLREWMEMVEVNVQGREAYGRSLDEAEQFMRTIVVCNQFKVFDSSLFLSPVLSSISKRPI